MRVVSVGDLVLDFYYSKDKLLGVNGGMTAHNIIANLANMKVNTSVFGTCGDDIAGDIAINSLSILGVDTTKIVKYPNIKTRRFHISCDETNTELLTSKKRCPFCNREEWYKESLIDEKEILKQIDDNDILVFDNLNQKNQFIIDNIKNLKLLDLGQYKEFEDLSKNEIIDKIKDKFKIINLNERVEQYFIKKFHIKSNLDLYKMLGADLIIVTYGKNGVEFLHDAKKYCFNAKETLDVVDTTGAGDSFFSSIINSWIKCDLIIEEKNFCDWNEKASKLAVKTIKKIGARSHLKSLYKVKLNKNICSCEQFEVVTRKQIKRCNINIKNLETRIINAVNSRAFEKIKKIDFNSFENYMFVGTGGSYAGAKFASILINKMYGSNTYAMYPRDVLYRNNERINKMFLFSYSGTTNDLLEGTKNFDNLNKYIVTKGEQQNIVLKTGISKKNIISYRTGSNKGKEKGFLSFEGAVAPASIFLKLYSENINVNFDIEKFIRECFLYWDMYFENKFKDTNMMNIFKKGNIINIFRGDFTDCACADIESKIIESGIVNCIIHEKKNFSHGRFINYENLNNKNNIYFKQKITSKYEEKLLNYFKKDNNFIIESRYNDILAEYDLLIASQFLIYYIGKVLDIDVSKPNYSEDAMKIYFYKGEL